MCKAQCVLVIALFLGLARSWNIAISVGDQLEFYTDYGTKSATVHLNPHNMTALAYDEVHNMLLFVSKLNNNDAICGYNMTSLDHKCYILRNGRNIQGLAFDPATEILYFTDTNEKSINWFSFKPESKNNIYGNLLIKMDDGVPTDLAVDSCRGYIYWINTKLETSTIERARFDGSERAVVINAKYNLDLHSLAIDQKTQTLYWGMPETILKTHTFSADLNEMNIESLIDWEADPSTISTYMYPNSYTVSKENLYVVAPLAWCSSCSDDSVWKFQKPYLRYNFENMFEVHTAGVVGIAANYKMKDQFQEILDCYHLLNNNETDDSFKIAREDEGLYCVHGTKVNGQHRCKCTPGYTGERCEVSVCENYCLHGNCSFTEQELPKCRCDGGYSGERCEVDVCHEYCSNNGTCSLNDDSGPVCQCQGDYVGHRCEISSCLNFCLQGNCSLNEEGLPECRCDAGYSGKRCEINACYQFCSNNGTCSLTEEDAPVCECGEEYEGERCEVPVALNNGDGALHKDETACQCDGSHKVPGQETDKNKNITSTSRFYSAERNLTLADLLANWQKPVVTISVVVEVKSKN